MACRRVRASSHACLRHVAAQIGCRRPPEVLAVCKDNSRGHIGHQLEVVIARSVPPTIRRQTGVLLLVGNDIEFGKSDPCSDNGRPVPGPEVEPTNGHRVRCGRPAEVHVAAAIEVRRSASVDFPVADAIGPELEPMDLCRQVHRHARRPRHPISVDDQFVADVTGRALAWEYRESLHTTLVLVFEERRMFAARQQRAVPDDVVLEPIAAHRFVPYDGIPLIIWRAGFPGSQRSGNSSRARKPLA